MLDRGSVARGKYMAEFVTDKSPTLTKLLLLLLLSIYHLYRHCKGAMGKMLGVDRMQTTLQQSDAIYKYIYALPQGRKGIAVNCKQNMKASID